METLLKLFKILKNQITFQGDAVVTKDTVHCDSN